MSVGEYWHICVKDNERVDQSAAEGTNKLQPKFMSFARARELVRTKILNQWRIEAENDPEYRGKQWFDIHGGQRQYTLSKSEGPKVVFKRGRHIITIPNEQKWPLGIGDKSKTNFFIKHFGKRQKEMARHVRFWTGHMPCGAFRERFHLEGYTHCWYCKAYEDREVLETRDHILFECRGWGRAFTDYHIIYEETDITPTGPIDQDGHFDKTPQFCWLSDQET